MPNPLRQTNVRSRGYLPHLEAPNAIYSVTFRLADSLPLAVLEAYHVERNAILAAAQQMNRPLSPSEQTRLADLYSERVEYYLDQGQGSCILRDARAAKIMADALQFFHSVRYQLFAWCVMPNHVHAVLQPLAPYHLPAILHSWKSFTSNAINLALGRQGPLWMPEYYDHLIRDDSDLAHACAYVRANPQKSHLPNWPWVSP